MLMVDVENAVIAFQIIVDEGQVSSLCVECIVSLAFPSQPVLTLSVFVSWQVEAFSHFGLLIYSLDRLYKAVRKSATESGEWARSDHFFLCLLKIITNLMVASLIVRVWLRSILSVCFCVFVKSFFFYRFEEHFVEVFTDFLYLVLSLNSVVPNAWSVKRPSITTGYLPFITNSTQLLCLILQIFFVCSLEKDIIELSKPRLSTFYKLAIASRMERVYEILVPIPKVR